MSNSTDRSPTARLGFGPFVFDAAAATLSRDGVEVPLAPRALRVLQFLIEHRERVVARRELLDSVWIDAVVGEESLTEAIARIREALGDDPKSGRYVRTVPRRGYRFVAPVFDPDSGVPRRRRGRALGALAVTSALALVAILTWPPALEEAPRIGSLAVLPFENLSADPETDYFAAGMTAALIDELGRDGRLGKVISRTSVLQYRDAGVPLPEIAAQLGVDGLIEAAVMRADDRVRIGVRLFHGPTETPLWSGTYEREVADVLRLVAEVATAIASEVAIEVGVASRESPRRYDPVAHDLYLQGLLQTGDYTIEGYERALERFEAAVGADPGHAPAHAMLAFALYTLAQPLASRDQGETMPRARAAAEEALRLDETLPEAHTALGWILMVYDRQFDAAERHLRRAMELNPSAALAHQGLAYLLALARGLPGEARAAARRARELAPLDMRIWMAAAEVEYAVRGFDEALALSDEALRREPEMFRAMLVRRWVGEASGDDDLAFAAHLDAVRIRGGSATLLDEIRAAWAAGGLAGVWRHRLDSRSYREQTELAEIHAALGEPERALDILEEAAAARPGIVLFLAYPRWDPIREEPRFVALQRTAGVAPERPAPRP